MVIEDLICPRCESDNVETTLHLVFKRVGNELKVNPLECELETSCTDCGCSVADERTEALARNKYSEAFGVDGD